jgi:hypothetical protein
MKQLLLVFILVSPSIFAQTWSDNVASIVYDKCSSCHHPGGIAPFSLMSYSEVSPMATAIYDAIATNDMPPWPPDENYQQYSHSRALSSTDKTTFMSWLSNGTPEGNPANAPAPPIFNSGSILGNGDLMLQIPLYQSKAQGGHDDYVCFSLPTGLTQNRYVRAMEIVPGNRGIVHHALIYIDPTGSYQGDTIGGNCGGPPQSSTLIGGYTPGSTPLIFPSATGFKLGMSIPANSNLVFAMHYPEGSFGQYDSTKVILHFYPPGETGIREVYAAPVLQNWSLTIPPNQLSSFTAQYPASGGVPTNYSILSVFPHMHLLGKSIRAYAVTPINDTVKFADIPNWDFHWQNFYFFKHLQKVPTGSVLKGEATYDNTVNNIDNPSNPPVLVHAGESTTDEMFLVYFHFLQYQSGDELIDLEGLLSLGMQELIMDDDWKIFPVPFTESVSIKPNQLKKGDLVSLAIYDYQGRLIRTICDKQTISTPFNGFEWDGLSENGAESKAGTYFISMICNGVSSSHPIIKN